MGRNSFAEHAMCQFCHGGLQVSHCLMALLWPLDWACTGCPGLARPGESTLYQCSPEAPAASVFADYSCIKHLLLLLDRRAENYALVSVK